MTAHVEAKSARNSSLDPLFKPRSVAHVGASPRSAPGRFNYTRFLTLMKFQGQIYPVNPKYDEMFEMPCYHRLADVPGEVDLAILAVPAVVCPGVLADVPPGKVKFVVIHTSGFGEIDKVDLEAEILRMAREKGFRVVGPNCMGVYSQQGRIGFWREHWEIVDRPGAVGFISQSGGHAVNVILGGMNTGINFNKVISLGNQLDVSINEVLEYMGQDDTIGVIGIYVEQIKDGRRFLNSLKQITPRKPVLVWKGGVTHEGKQAAATHTGSIAGNEQIFAAAIRQAGAVSIDEFQHLLRMLRLLQPQFQLPGPRLAVFSPGGGNSVSISDIFATQPNLKLPPLAPETQRKLREILPEENVDVKNPVDPGAVGMMRLDQLLKAVGMDPVIDSIILLVSVDYLSNIRSEESRVLAVEMIADLFVNRAAKINKPIYALLNQHRQNHEDYDRYRRIMIDKFNEKKIPWTDGSFKDAAHVFSQLVKYRRYRESQNP
ncbi:MAG: acetate--CoA ligase family protein [Candidatus Abyssubacteria bacterium]